MRLLTSTPERGRRGLSLIEVVIVAAIMTMLVRSLLEATASMGRMTATGNVRALLQEQGERALSALIDDLRRSGAVVVDGKDYPYVFDGGEADAPFDGHDHTPAVQEAQAGDADFGVMREVVLVLPADLDRNGVPDLDMDHNGWPELDGDGDGTASESEQDYDGITWDPAAHTIDPDTGVVWSHQEISYVTVTKPDGINYLERRRDAEAASAKRVARDVERVQIDTWESSGFSIAMNTVRVQVFLRRRTDEGVLFRHQVEVTVKLRNTKEAG